ncbi:hypothetical protein NXS19_013305 [Fusarium pseudograminearum]|nr:hypothetical protein NXS19_013305 [Fusarium pseudograminearum]
MLSQTLLPQSLSMQNSSASGANNPEQHLRAQLELLKNHDATGSSSPTSPAPRDTRHQPLQPAPARPSNGFDHSPNPQDQPRALAAKGEVEAHIHPDLRARANNAPTATMMPIVPPSGHSPGASAGPSNAPIASMPPPHMSPDDHGDGRSKAKRELSQSKRAAQNRAAQRAFRQRKEGYIKKLEQQVREYMDMEQSFKSLQPRGSGTDRASTIPHGARMMSYDNITYNTKTHSGSTIIRAIEFEPALRRTESIPKNATEVTKLVSEKAVPSRPMPLATWNSCVMARITIDMMVLSFGAPFASVMDTV